MPVQWGIERMGPKLREVFEKITTAPEYASPKKVGESIRHQLQLILDDLKNPSKLTREKVMMIVEAVMSDAIKSHNIRATFADSIPPSTDQIGTQEVMRQRVGKFVIHLYFSSLDEVYIFYFDQISHVDRDVT